MKNFWKIFFATLLALVLAMFVGFFLLIGVISGIATMGKKPTEKPKPNTVLVFELNRPIVDRDQKSIFDEMFNELFSQFDQERPVGLNTLLKTIKNAKQDDNIRGILLRPEMLNAGMATIDELRQALIDFKSSGKFVYSYGDFYTQKAYYLATTADKIYLNPVGVVVWTGLSAQIMHFKNTLKKLGIEPQVIRHGKFKSAVEPFVLEEISPENRLQTATFLNSMWNHMLEQVGQARKIDPSKLQQWADELAITDATAALKNRLIDSLVYFDQMRKIIVEMTEEDKDGNFPSMSFYKYTNAAPQPKGKLITEQSKIAVIYAQGQIGMGKGNNEEIGLENIANAIVEARRDDKVKAIVMRINSPGGSALTSEVILREALLTKGIKPIIISMGDVAASGGYYIACAADTIVAQPTTITGSIGVFGLMFNLKELMNSKLGITFSTVNTAKYSDFSSPFRKMSDTEKKMLQNQIESIYQTFVNHVSNARNKTFEEVDDIAQGRVWSGADAKNIGLVDVLGGLDDAIEIAARKAGVSDYRIEELPKLKDPFEALFGATESSMSKFSQHRLVRKTIEHIENLINLNGINARMEYDIEIE